MDYIYTEKIVDVVDDMASRITQLLLDDKKVLWLLSGGSGGRVCVEVAKRLNNIPHKNLFVTLTDERFAPVGHPDENWRQLLEEGLSLPDATMYRPLQGGGSKQTTQDFIQWLTMAKTKADYTIGVFGMGVDGHTAGIKPGSAAVASQSIAAYFNGEDFDRITITPTFIDTIDEAVVQVFGSEKQEALSKLLRTGVSPEEQPAQALKRVPVVRLYSDYNNQMEGSI